MRSHLRSLPVLMIASLAAASAIALAPAPVSWDEAAARRKAESLFYEAQTAYSLEDYARYITLVQRAFELDSTDPGNTNEWALLTLQSYEDTLLPQHKRAYNYLRTNFFSHPDNYNSGELLANVAMQIGRYDDVVRVWEVLDSVFPTRSEIGPQLAKAYLISYGGWTLKQQGKAGYDGDSASYDKAMAIYSRMEQGSGKNPQLSAAKIRAYLLKGDTASIVDEVTDLTRHMPANSETMLFAAHVLQAIDSNSLSLKYIDRACQLDSTNGEAFLARAEYYRDRGDSAAFDREVFHALRSSGLEVESKVEILRTYVSELFTDSTQQGRIRELFAELQQVNAGEPEIHNLYAAYLMAVDEKQEAVEQLTYSVELNPGENGTWYALLQTASQCSDTATIMHYAPMAMERMPDEFYFPIILADAYRQADQPTRAVEVMEGVEVREVRNPKAVSSFIGIKGDMYASAGDTIKALELYDEAIALDPENFMAMNNAAYFMAENGITLEKAEDLSARTIAADATNPTYLDTYAWVFFKRKDYKMAKHYIDLAMKYYLHPAEETPEGEAEEGEAEEAATDADEEQKITFDVYDHAGDIYFMNGEPARALEFWQKAHKLEPDNELVARKVKFRTIFFK